MAKPPPIDIDWRDDDLYLLLDEVVPEILTEIAFQTQGQTQVNIRNNGQVLTGAMVNSCYTDAPDLDNYEKSKQAARTANPNVILAPKREHRSDYEAVVGVAVNYAVFQEKRKSFLFAAVQRQQGKNTGAVIRKIAKARKLTR